MKSGMMMYAFSLRDMYKDRAGYLQNMPSILRLARQSRNPGIVACNRQMDKYVRIEVINAKTKMKKVCKLGWFVS